MTAVLSSFFFVSWDEGAWFHMVVVHYCSIKLWTDVLTCEVVLVLVVFKVTKPIELK